MNTKLQARRRTSVRQRLCALLGAALLMLLAACGAKIDTVLTIDAAGAGTREITLTFSEDDELEDYLVGGVDAVDASINKHKPDEIEYLGIEEEGGVLTATFVVEFADLDEYLIKTKALLAAGNHTWSDYNVHKVEQNPLLNGVAIEEDFSSATLMDWLFNGLLADEVVAESNSGSMYEVGDTKVIFGERKEATGDYIDFDAIKDLGFTSVSMETDVSVAPMSRSVHFWIEDRAQYVANQEVYEAYFDSISSDQISVEVVSDGLGQSWSASFSGSSEELVAATATALSSDNIVFQLETGPSEDNPAVLKTTINNFAECNSICTQHAIPMVDTVTLPENLTSGNFYSENGTQVEYDFGSDAEPIVFEVSPQFTGITYDLEINPEGSVELAADFRVSKTDVELTQDGFQGLIVGSSDVELQTKEVDEDVVFSLLLTAQSASEFEQVYNSWSEGDSYFVEVPLPGNTFFKSNYLYDGTLSLPSRFYDSLPSDFNVDYNFEINNGNTFVQDTGGAPSGMTFDRANASMSTSEPLMFSLEVSGRTIKGFVLLGVIALTVVGVVITLIVFRKQIAAKLNSAPGASSGATEGASYTPQQYSPPGPTGGFATGSTPPPATPPVPSPTTVPAPVTATPPPAAPPTPVTPQPTPPVPSQEGTNSVTEPPVNEADFL